MKISDNPASQRSLLEVFNSGSKGQWREMDIDSSTDSNTVNHATSMMKNVANGLGNLAMAPLALITMPIIAATLSTELALKGPGLFLLKGLKDLAIDAPMHGVALLLGK